MKFAITEMYPLNNNGTRRTENTTLSSALHTRILNLKLTYATGVSGRTAPAVLWIVGSSRSKHYTTNIFRSFKRHSGL